MLGLLAQLAGLFFVLQLLAKRRQTASRFRIELVLMTKVEIEPQQFPVKNVVPAADRLMHQLGVKPRTDIRGHVFHGLAAWS